MRFLVLGGGLQGSAAAFDLMRTEGVESVTLADRPGYEPPAFLREPRSGSSSSRLVSSAEESDGEGDGGGEQVGRRESGLRVIALDASDRLAVRAAMDDVDAVVCALPYFFNYDMSELAILAGAHFCDLGGNTEIVERQRTLDARARIAGVSVIPDCGLAPGMVNILAQAGIDALEKVDSLKLLVGGLPQNPKPPLNYQVVYSLEGVLDYYTTPSIMLEGGEVTEVEALSDVEAVDFPELGELEAFHTAGGISTMPYRYRGKIDRMEYKTLRYPGHAAIMKAVRDLGLFSTEPIEVNGRPVTPRSVFIETVRPKLMNASGDDVVALRVEVEGTRGGERVRIRYDLLDRYDPENGITAMMRTTGYSLALTSVMQADGRVKETGVHTPDECMPAEEYVREMEARGVKITRSEEALAGDPVRSRGSPPRSHRRRDRAPNAPRPRAPRGSGYS
jgi:lysine 6-dehydrogenase